MNVYENQTLNINECLSYSDLQCVADRNWHFLSSPEALDSCSGLGGPMLLLGLASSLLTQTFDHKQ